MGGNIKEMLGPRSFINPNEGLNPEEARRMQESRNRAQNLALQKFSASQGKKRGKPRAKKEAK